MCEIRDKEVNLGTVSMEKLVEIFNKHYKTENVTEHEESISALEYLRKKGCI